LNNFEVQKKSVSLFETCIMTLKYYLEIDPDSQIFL